MIRAVLVDDEPLALERLSRMLQQSGVVEVLGTFSHPAEALLALSETRPDVFFLDIEMPGIDGLALADQLLSVEPTTQIVFVTAYNEYAIEAFELNALDYLLKPVRRERLLKTLSRITKENSEEEKARLKVICLGGFRVFLDMGDNSIFRWRTSKAEELFAFLVHHRGQAVRRQMILDAVWEHLDGDRATAHFHTTLYYLRRSMDSAGFPGLIHHESGLYWVDTSRIDCDYYELSALALSKGDRMKSSAFATKLVSLYQGGYLEGEGWLWAEAARQDLEERYLSALLQVHDEYLAERDITSAIAILKEALRITPVNETIHGKLIHAYMLINDRVAAIEQYEVLRSKLKAEYGIEPSDLIRNMLPRE
ncbi:response regulator [Alicyclobacillus sp. ALC3]|uniref:response regulator n=1 Tax=Alicyclobacillus sp. ALC3 TaxID=2796143 RepID=UPI002378DBA2|nr:response regulator [Alicyclobacillus sp. ALC3]WDL95643.1 response regulator [Alicyclobacillus sp. ALC3]